MHVCVPSVPGRVPVGGGYLVPGGRGTATVVGKGASVLPCLPASSVYVLLPSPGQPPPKPLCRCHLGKQEKGGGEGRYGVALGPTEALLLD